MTATGAWPSVGLTIAADLTLRGWIERDSNLDPVREHPRFRALLKSLGREPRDRC